MAWQKLLYSRKDVNEAGATLIDPNADDILRNEALKIVNNWRACHYFPLNTIQNGLRQKATKVNERSLVAQRIKRLPSILQKLRDIETMKLAQIQDIGGCRAVVESVPQVRRLVSLYDMSRHKHVFVRDYDYISKPKETGYRSFHLVYRYRSPSGANKVYDGLKIELQLRTKLQHSWATAVETVGAFTGQALKASRGAEDWLRFFVLMSAVFAEKEKSPTVPFVPGNPLDLKRELIEYCNKLDVVTHLEAYNVILKHMPRLTSQPNLQYHLLLLDTNKPSITVKSYSSDNLQKAFQHYSQMEDDIKNQTGMDTVLVSAKSIKELKRSFPNYFLDTHNFLTEVQKAIR